MRVAGEQKLDLRPLKGGSVALRPNPCRKGNRRDAGLTGAWRNVDQEVPDLTVHHGFKVFGYRLKVPAVNIRIWINVLPTTLNEVNKTSLALVALDPSPLLLQRQSEIDFAFTELSGSR